MNIYQEAFVYKWINLTNNYIYIGYHKGTADDGYICSSRSQRFWNDFNDPKQDFVREIVAQGSVDDMIILEKKLLADVDINSDSVYNNSRGNGIIFTQEVRKKMSEAGRRKTLSEDHKRKISKASSRYRHSPETREKLSTLKLKEKNPMYGKQFSENHRKKLREAAKNKTPRGPMSQHTKEKISKAKTGISIGTPSENHKKNLSKSLKGIVWITNGIETRGIKSNEEVPNGWYRGRAPRAKKNA